MSAQENKVKLYSRIAAVLVVLMLLMQFVPYWHYGEGETLSASISSYVWFPYNHTDLTAHLTSISDSHHINPVAWSSVAIVVLCLVVSVFSLRKQPSCVSCVLLVITGIVGLISYLSIPAYQASSCYAICLVLFALMMVVGCIGIFAGRNKT